MHKIQRIEVHGFRGANSVDMQLNPDVNFLIGRNGTGKTTFINLINAILNADI